MVVVRQPRCPGPTLDGRYSQNPAAAPQLKHCPAVYGVLIGDKPFARGNCQWEDAEALARRTQLADPQAVLAQL
jgi:hypothetical protein